MTKYRSSFVMPLLVVFGGLVVTGSISCKGRTTTTVEREEENKSNVAKEAEDLKRKNELEELAKDAAVLKKATVRLKELESAITNERFAIRNLRRIGFIDDIRIINDPLLKRKKLFITVNDEDWGLLGMIKEDMPEQYILLIISSKIKYDWEPVDGVEVRGAKTDERLWLHYFNKK